MCQRDHFHPGLAFFPLLSSSSSHGYGGIFATCFRTLRSNHRKFLVSAYLIPQCVIQMQTSRRLCNSSMCSNLSVYCSYLRSGIGLFLAYPALFSVYVSLFFPHFLAESAHTAWVFSLAGFGKGVCSHQWGKASSSGGFTLRAGTGLASTVTFLIQ